MKLRALKLAVGGCIIITTTHLAIAQTDSGQLASEPAPPPPPTVIIMPPAATRSPGARLHDGFYMRLSLGVGPGSATENVTGLGATNPEIKYSGFSAMFDALFGGSPTPGFVLGGGLVSHRILSPSVKWGGQTLETGDNVSLNLTTFGLFTAVYPDPTIGFNLHLLVGYAVISASNGNNETSSNNPVGPAFMGGVGYDFWVGDQWSIGPDFRVAYSKGTYERGGAKDSVSMFFPTLSFTATYH